MSTPVKCGWAMEQLHRGVIDRIQQAGVTPEAHPTQTEYFRLFLCHPLRFAQGGDSSCNSGGEHGAGSSLQGVGGGGTTTLCLGYSANRNLMIHMTLPTVTFNITDCLPGVSFIDK